MPGRVSCSITLINLFTYHCTYYVYSFTYTIITECLNLNVGMPEALSISASSS